MRSTAKTKKSDKEGFTHFMLGKEKSSGRVSASSSQKSKK